MKKIFILFIICFGILPFSVGAIPDRTVEIGLVNLSLGLANDFISAKEILKETVEIDLDDLKDGLKMDLGLSLSPLYFNYNKKDKAGNKIWGFGLSTKVDLTGLIGISGDMLSFSKAVDSKSEIGAAAFAEVGVPVYFHIDSSIGRFKIKVKPALYYPLVYVEPDISYTFNEKKNGDDWETKFSLGYKVRAYTAGPFENGLNGFSLTSSPGIDFHLGAEYPLSEVLGLSDILSFLTFDVGLDIINLPLVPGAMKDYMDITGHIGTDGYVNIFDADLENFATTNDPVYGVGSKDNILRPFKMLAWADWRPLGGKRLISLIPSLGFAINPLYVEPLSMEGGVKARLDLANIFIVTLGINHTDRLWKNSVDLALNLRAFELDLGLDVRSEDFAKSFEGAGAALNIGLKLGW